MKVDVDIVLEDMLNDYDIQYDLFMALANYFLNKYHTSSRAAFILMLAKDIKQESPKAFAELLSEMKELDKAP